MAQVHTTILTERCQRQTPVQMRTSRSSVIGPRMVIRMAGIECRGQLRKAPRCDKGTTDVVDDEVIGSSVSTRDDGSS